MVGTLTEIFKPGKPILVRILSNDKEKGRIRLQPENAALEPIFAPHVQILGKVVGVFRTL